ncbi:MAG: CorA family divalent cation transporter [Angustibacter sp.]
MQTVTQAEAPDRWAGPSVLVTVACGDSSVIAASGWFSRLLDWEERFPGPVRQLHRHGLDFGAVGDAGLLVEADPASIVQIEAVLEDSGIDEVTMDLLSIFIPHEIFRELVHLPMHDAVTVNANRDTFCPESWSELGASFIDIPVNTLPSTRGGALPIIAATRWVRVVRWNRGLLMLWSPVSGYWEPGHVRWPHHGIPSRSKQALNSMLGADLTADQRLLLWFQEVIAHEKYFLDAWTTELEHWEARLFQQLAEGDSTYAALELPPLQRDIGVLASYLDRVRASERFFLRRAEVSSLVGHVLNLPELFWQTQSELKIELQQARGSLRSAFDLLSSVSQGAQAYAAAESQKSQERLNALITTVTTVLFVPSLVAAVFGANIRELSPESSGSLPQLFGLMFAMSVASMGALRWVRIGRLGLASVILLGLGASLAAAVYLWRDLRLLALVWGLAWLLLGVASILHKGETSRVRSN